VGWREQYDRMMRWHARLSESTSVDDRRVDEFYAFFTCSFHLKDWLTADLPAASGIEADVEAFVNGRLCSWPGPGRPRARPRPTYQLQWGYTASVFDNGFSWVRVDNPCNPVPAPAGACPAVGTQGQFGTTSLPPDNQAHTFNVAGGINLPLRTPDMLPRRRAGAAPDQRTSAVTAYPRGSLAHRFSRAHTV